MNKNIDIEKRIGIKRTNKAGICGECIEYNCANDIKIRLDNNEVINGRWDNFNNGHFGGKCKPIIERIGERRKNNQGSWMTIITYNNKNDISVIFDTGYKVDHTRYSDFKNGAIKDLLFPNVLDVGYIGIGKYKISENGKATKAYDKWRSMLNRCYGKNHENYNPSYQKCIVDTEWLCFQNFAKWFEDNYYTIPNQKMCLDKDILIKNNKIYSPNTCCIVPEDINILFTKSDSIRGKYPIGVLYKDGGYVATYSVYKKHIYLGKYNTVVEAFNAYKKAKEEEIKNRANKYKNYLPTNVYNALYKYEVNIED